MHRKATSRTVNDSPTVLSTGWLRRSDLPRRWRAAKRTIGLLLRWAVLIEFAYVYSFPVIHVVTSSIKNTAEFDNPVIRLFSRQPTLEGYRYAWLAMGYPAGLRNSFLISTAAVLGQTLVGAMVGYGFARLRFPGRDLLFGILLFTIIVPLQVVIIPQYMLYTELRWMNSFLPLIVPPFFGQGVRAGILLIVYRQFFRGLPYELQDAAYVDGAGPFRAYWQIMLPLAKPAILVVALFSLVWTWNDHYTPFMMLRDIALYTLPLRLNGFRGMVIAHMGLTTGVGSRGEYTMPQSVFPAAVTLAVLPLLVIYVFTQRYFTQSIDRTGLVE